MQSSYLESAVKQTARSIALAVSTLVLAACGDSGGSPTVVGGGSSSGAGSSGGGGPSPAAECVYSGPQAARNFSTSTSRTASGTGCDKSTAILSDAVSFRDAAAPTGANADGKTLISAHVFVPAFTPGQTFPIILHSHGWSVHNVTATTPITPGSKSMFTIADQLVSNLSALDGGYIVVSFDERGWGQSEGEIAVMAPERETQDAKAVIDWLVAEGKAGRLPVQFDDAAQTDPRIGSIGGSYGGGFQFLLAAEDPRLDTMVPLGTWHDLIYALTPHRYTPDLNFAPGIFKQTFVTGLCLLSNASPLTSSTGRRDDALAQACSAPQTSRTREEWDPTNTVIDFGDSHGLRWYQNNPGMSPVSAADSKSGLAPGAGFAQRGAIPTFLWQGSRDVLFNFNEAMWNYQYLRSLAPNVEVKLFTNGSGHSSAQWTGQTLDGSNCGRFEFAASIRAWLKKYLKNDAADWAALNAPNVCMYTENSGSNGLTQHGVSLTGVTEGAGDAGITASAQMQDVTAATLGSNAYVFKPVGDPISGSNKVLAGVPVLSAVTVCAPVVGCNNNSAFATESVALVAVGIRRGTQIIAVDDQVFPIRGSDADGMATRKFPLPGIAETLQDGDQLGLILFARHPQYDVRCIGVNQGGNLGPYTPPCGAATATPDYYSFTADVALPVLTVNGGSVQAHTGTEP